MSMPKRAQRKQVPGQARRKPPSDRTQRKQAPVRPVRASRRRAAPEQAGTRPCSPLVRAKRKPALAARS